MPNTDWQVIVLWVALGIAAAALGMRRRRDWDPRVGEEAVKDSLRRRR